MKNEFGFVGEDTSMQQIVSASAQANESKSIQEIQAALVIAKKFPRDQMKAYESIMNACKRKSLAESSIYAYPKGNQVVTGPSIRLAEVLAQSWGNIKTGIVELSQANGVSEVKAFAWDLETNYESFKIFHVPHVRHTKFGSKTLTDPRDIYEMVANQGSRRLRACILAVIPGDVVDSAVTQCEDTLKSGSEPIAERVKKLVVAFSEMGVNVEMLVKRLGHNLDVVIEAELVVLRGIYKSIKDGMAKREDFFDLVQESQQTDIENLIKGKSKPAIREIKQELTQKEQAEILAKELAGE